jgi:hypothetical protein
MEFGYMFLNVLVKSVGGNYTLFLLLTNLFVLIAYVKFAFTNSKTPIYIFVLLMFSTQFFPVRIGIAVAFIILGMSEFSQKKYKRVIICTLIAISIHSSAVIFIPVYFSIFCVRIPTMLAVSICVFTMWLVRIEAINSLFSVLAESFNMIDEGELAYKFEHYLDYNTRGVQVVTGNITSIIFIVTLTLFGYMIKEINQQKEKINYDFLYNIYFVFVLLGIAFSSENMLGLKRLQNYFMFAFPILFSTFIVCGKKKYSQYRLCFTAIFIMYILFRSYTLFFGGYPEAHFPYNSILNR